MSLRHTEPVTEKHGEVDLASVGALFGDPARAAMLVALSDGRALPPGELARSAGVRPATATTHLRRLVDGGLVQVTVQGRHRYHQLAGPQVSAILEALAQLAPTIPVSSLSQHCEQSILAPATTTSQDAAASSYATGYWPPEHSRPSTTGTTPSPPAVRHWSPTSESTSTACGPGAASSLDHVWTGPSAGPISPVLCPLPLPMRF